LQDYELFGLSEERGVEITAKVLYFMVQYDPTSVAKILTKEFSGDELHYAMFTYGYWVGLFNSGEYAPAAERLYDDIKVLVMVGNCDYKVVEEYIKNLFSTENDEDDSIGGNMDYIM